MPDEPPAHCGQPMLRIAYGFPRPDVWKASERGEVVLGGCVIDDRSPRWSCAACGATAGRLDLWGGDAE